MRQVPVKIQDPFLIQARCFQVVRAMDHIKRRACVLNVLLAGPVDSSCNQNQQVRRGIQIQTPDQGQMKNQHKNTLEANAKIEVPGNSVYHRRCAYCILNHSAFQKRGPEQKRDHRYRNGKPETTQIHKIEETSFLPC